MNDAIEVIDEGLTRTIERGTFPSDEVRDLLLDVRQAILREARTEEAVDTNVQQ